jgi:cell division protein FtsI (penicillin-binding protein 3)
LLGGRRGEAEQNRTGRAVNRLFLLGLVAFLWSLGILSRLVQLQVVSHSVYKQAADRQQIHKLRIDAPRGVILDRNQRVLAMSVPVDSVALNPLRVPERPLAAQILARVLGIDGQDLLAKMDRAVEEHRRAQQEKRKPHFSTGFLWAKRKISQAESEALRSLKLDWVEFRKEPHRYYPDGSLASHLVGTVDFQERGNLGLEQKLDSELSGRPGLTTVLADVLERGIESSVSKPAEAGKTVVLTLDQRIQFVVERELKAACEFYHATSGSAVVMNPYSGEVLGLASYPTFDPNDPPPPLDPSRIDHPVMVSFEPGSVFKIITVSTALETTALTPDSPINCGGGVLRLGYRTIHEAKRGYGMLSVADVLAKSSNIGAIQIGLRVGSKNFHRYVRLFGFGSKTGVPLASESFGSVNPNWQKWSLSTLASMSMGHEVSTTAIQLAQACSVIANGGIRIRPKLILSRQRPGGKPEPEVSELPERILKPETAITMRQLMEGVVLHGTGRAARLAGYTSGGKTGSAQIVDPATGRYTHFYNGSFVGFAPVTNPAIVIAVTLNGVTKFGGVVAAPVFKGVAAETLRILQVPKDIPDVEPEPVPEEETADLAIAGLGNPPEQLGLAPDRELAAPPAAPQPSRDLQGGVPSFSGKTVRAVLEQALAAGLTVDVIGSGLARAQWPVAGSVLGPGERVRVQFQ